MYWSRAKKLLFAEARERIIRRSGRLMWREYLKPWIRDITKNPIRRYLMWKKYK